MEVVVNCQGFQSRFRPVLGICGTRETLQQSSVYLCRPLKVLAALLLSALVLASAMPAQAQTQTPVKEPRFCYMGFCSPRLATVEAHLRATAGSYGFLWTKVSTTKYMETADGPAFRILYEVEDQEPSVMYPPGYETGSKDAKSGICSANADPYEPTRCADEDEGVAGVMGFYRATWPACTHTEHGYEGSHGSPYVSIRQEQRRGRITFLAGGSAATKSYVYTVWCPGWGGKRTSGHKKNAAFEDAEL